MRSWLAQRCGQFLAATSPRFDHEAHSEQFLRPAGPHIKNAGFWCAGMPLSPHVWSVENIVSDRSLLKPSMTKSTNEVNL
jgi:hypothetical protein